VPDVRRILCPIDFSEASRAALDQAAAIAEWFGASITAVHVSLPARIIEGPPPFVAPPRATSRHTCLGAARPDESAPTPRSWLAVDAVVLEDSMSTGDSGDWYNAHADLIVIGTHGRTARLADRRLRHRQDPPPRGVWSRPAACRDTSATPQFKQVAVPDRFRTIAAALRFGCRRRGRRRAPTLLHVLPDPASRMAQCSDSPRPRPL
jgi:nucleotide-binding universal stress UspA family protein